MTVPANYGTEYRSLHKRKIPHSKHAFIEIVNTQADLEKMLQSIHGRRYGTYI